MDNLNSKTPSVAIVDYGMGNLFSVQAACAAAGLDATITAAPGDLDRADGVILPGVGAFGEAMRRLREQRMDAAVRGFVERGRPFLAICLGLQLLFDTSEEFGSSEGLRILSGRVVRFPAEGVGKVPEIGWNRIQLASPRLASDWAVPALAGIHSGEYFYFVHSYFVEPLDRTHIATTTQYGHVLYASSVTWRNVFACQFHPERSGPAGLRIYRNFAETLRRRG